MRLLRRGNRVVALRSDNGLVARTENGPCCCGPQEPGVPCGCVLGGMPRIDATADYSYEERRASDNAIIQSFSGSLSIAGIAPVGPTAFRLQDTDGDATLSVQSRFQTGGVETTARLLLRPVVSDLIDATQTNAFVYPGALFLAESNRIVFDVAGLPPEIENRDPIRNCNPSDAFANSGQGQSGNILISASVNVTWAVSQVTSIPCP